MCWKEDARKMKRKSKTWFITGCTSGFGRALSEHCLGLGDRVAVTALAVEDVADISKRYGKLALPLKLDVTKPAEVRAALEHAFETFGHLDVLVNNAGYAIQASVEDGNDRLIRQMFEVNMFGLLDVVRAALPRLRQQGHGHIINFSSVGGRVSGPLVALYCATKFAVEGLSLGLAAEVAPFGLKVTVIEPGAFATNFAAAAIRPEASEPYRARSEQMKGLLATLPLNDPAVAARVIAQVADSETPPLQMIVGEDAYVQVLEFEKQQRLEMEAWRALSVSASHPAA
jgi:NAD(P)-dependent dehydrogenase (short-subunit alcohol dehydrogenase family)